MDFVNNIKYHVDLFYSSHSQLNLEGSHFTPRKTKQYMINHLNKKTLKSFLKKKNCANLEKKLSRGLMLPPAAFVMENFLHYIGPSDWLPYVYNVIFILWWLLLLFYLVYTVYVYNVLFIYYYHLILLWLTSMSHRNATPKWTRDRGLCQAAQHRQSPTCSCVRNSGQQKTHFSDAPLIWVNYNISLCNLN